MRLYCGESVFPTAQDYPLHHWLPSVEHGRRLMQTRQKLNPGQKGTKKFLAEYGEQLVCVRYRYDERRRKRFTTVELIMEESDWVPKARRLEPEKIVGVRVAWPEAELQKLVKRAGGKWNREKRLWELSYARVVELGLQDRVVEPASL